MKYTVNRLLNVRTGSPSVNASKIIPLERGEVVEVIKAVEGDSYEGNKLWFEGVDGHYYWSGGFVESSNVANKNMPIEVPRRKIKFESLAPSLISDNLLCWSQRHFGIKQIWEHTYGEGVRVAILDSGINSDHPDLKNTIVGGWNFMGKNGDFSDASHSHGTNVAGIIASQGKKYYGIAPGVELLIGKIYKEAFDNDDLILEGINYAIKNGADIINMSFTYTAYSDKIERAILAAKDKCIFVAACGDEGKVNAIFNNYPASYPGVISVGALNSLITRYGYSSKSDHLDVMAPGENICSCAGRDSYTQDLSDSSFAAPFITGILALFISLCKKRNKAVPFINLENMIKNACYLPDGKTGRNLEYGYGIINIDKLFSQI